MRGALQIGIAEKSGKGYKLPITMMRSLPLQGLKAGEIITMTYFGRFPARKGLVDFDLVLVAKENSPRPVQLIDLAAFDLK